MGADGIGIGEAVLAASDATWSISPGASKRVSMLSQPYGRLSRTSMASAAELEGADGCGGCWARLKSNRGNNPKDDLIELAWEELNWVISGFCFLATKPTSVILNIGQKINRIETKEL